LTCTVYLEEMTDGAYGAVFCVNGGVHKKIALNTKEGINRFHAEVMTLQAWDYDVKFTGAPLE